MNITHSVSFDYQDKPFPLYHLLSQPDIQVSQAHAGATDAVVLKKKTMDALIACGSRVGISGMIKHMDDTLTWTPRYIKSTCDQSIAL